MKNTPSESSPTHAEKTIYHIHSCKTKEEHGKHNELESKATTATYSKSFVEKLRARQTIIGSQWSTSFPCLEAISRNSLAPHLQVALGNKW